MMFKYYKNDKEFEQDKAIEEMTDYLFWNAISHDTQFKGDCRSIARDLYNAGYRKILEGAVVLTREQYEKDLAIERELGERKASRARKETAEKFKKLLKALVAERNFNEDYDWEDVQVDGQIFIECVDEICKEIIGEEKW